MPYPHSLPSCNSSLRAHWEPQMPVETASAYSYLDMQILYHSPGGQQRERSISVLEKHMALRSPVYMPTPVEVV